MSGYAKVQELRAKLKPFRKYSGHYMKSPEIKLLLQENVTACQQFMVNKGTSELSTINTKVLLHWSECLYGLGRKFGEKKMLPVACEKYEIVAKFTGPQDDYLVYCKWAIAECELSLHPMFFRDGRGKKVLYKKGESLFKKSLEIANKSSSKRSRVLYSWALALFRYSRSCESMCTSKEVFRMYQKAGQMFYDAYTVNPNNKDAIYKWGKLLDSQALIISHRNDPDLLLADDVELFLIVFSSLAMRGKLHNLKILIALCLSPEEVTQHMAIEVLEHLGCFLDNSSQIPPTPRAPPSPPPTPLFTPGSDAPYPPFNPGSDVPHPPFNPSVHPIFTSKESMNFPEVPKVRAGNSSPFKRNSPRIHNPFDSPKVIDPFAKGSPKPKGTNPFETDSPIPPRSNNHKGTNPFETNSPNPHEATNSNSTSPQSPRSQPETPNDNKETTNPFDLVIPFSSTSKPILLHTSPIQSRVSKLSLPPSSQNINISNAKTDVNNPASVVSPATSPAPPNRVAQLLGTSKTNSPDGSPLSVVQKLPALDLNLNDSGGMGIHGEFMSPTAEESRTNQKAIMEEAQGVLVWIRQIIVQNHTLTPTTKMQALRSLGEEGQRVWRAAKIPYQEALDNFEVFANCINFHTKRQLVHLQKYLSAPDDLQSTTPSTTPTTTPSSSPPSTPIIPAQPVVTATQGLIRSDSAPIVRSHWLDQEATVENGKKEVKPNGGSSEKGGSAERKPSPEKKEGGKTEKNEKVEHEPHSINMRPQRSKSFGSRLKLDHEQILIHEDIHKYYINHNKIGRGGFGDVYTAKSKKTGKTVALKSMRRNFEDHFKQIKREIKMMKCSVHPNMVNYIESFICDDHVWIVMEYCDGGSLRFFAKNTLLEESHISYIGKQVLSALSYLHSHNRIHRDIKADNVLLNLDASVKLADLGIAADLDDPDTPSELMNLCGSKFWMAPEMIKFKPYNYKVDIWGFGCLLIELAEGRHPYEGQHSMAAMFHTATKGADSLSNPEKWSDLFHDFLGQCFQMNPAIRPSADDLLQHPFIVLYDTEEGVQEIKQDIVQRLDNVFVSLQLEHILF